MGEANKQGKKGRRKSKAKLVKDVLRKMEQRLEGDDLKPSVGDFIRLLQLDKELAEGKQPKEIKVSWVEPKPERESGK